MILLLFLIITPTIQNDMKSITSKQISEIITYFEQEEKIEHEKIDIYSSMNSSEFEVILELVKIDFPHLEIIHISMERSDKKVCSLSTSDLSIMIPNDNLKTKHGKFQYSFQSHIKNIFGTLTIDVNGNMIVTNKQFFTTSIGD